MKLSYLLYFSAHPSRGFAHFVFTSLFHLMWSFAYFSAVDRGRDVSSLTISVHLFGSLSLPLLFLKSSFSDLFTKLSSGSLHTCQTILAFSTIWYFGYHIQYWPFCVFFSRIFYLLTWCWGLILGNYFLKLTALECFL